MFQSVFYFIVFSIIVSLIIFNFHWVKIKKHNVIRKHYILRMLTISTVIQVFVMLLLGALSLVFFRILIYHKEEVYYMYFLTALICFCVSSIYLARSEIVYLNFMKKNNFKKDD